MTSKQGRGGGSKGRGGSNAANFRAAASTSVGGDGFTDNGIIKEMSMKKTPISPNTTQASGSQFFNPHVDSEELKNMYDKFNNDPPSKVLEIKHIYKPAHSASKIKDMIEGAVTAGKKKAGGKK
eukprot:Tbor_TRINITY_DN5817_c1_g2::TRINITY_DN5817_c1_g2_i1::g.6642::m.6642